MPPFFYRLLARTAAFWLAGLLCAASAAPKRVMILNPYSRDTAPFSAVVSSFRTTLAAEMDGPLDFHEIPLDLTRFTVPGEEALAAFLQKQLAANPVDLVVPVGGAGARFAERHHELLFRDTPILIAGAVPRMIPQGFLEKTNVTLVTQPIDLPGMIKQILAMKPSTKRIAMVFGAAEMETQWANECRREFAEFNDRLDFIWLDGLSFGEMLDRCSSLPPDSFIFHGLFIEDAERIPCSQNQALLRLREVANAPVFAVFKSEIGLGSVGGSLFRDTEIGEQSARVAARILQGEAPNSIPPIILEPGPPVYDWRELRRWNIREAKLPADRVIRFREPSFWERYRWQAVGVTGFGVLQAGLIVGLLANRTRRRREAEGTALMADISSRFVNLPASEVDREIQDALRRICALLTIDMSVLWQWDDRTPGNFAATHVHSLKDGPQPPAAMSAEEFPWVREEIIAGRAVVFRSLDELPAAASKDRDNAQRLKIRSSLSLPLSLGGETPIGILGFNTTRQERSWPTELVDRLQLVAGILANALARKKADHDLRESAEVQRLALEQAMELRVSLAHVGRVSLMGQFASALAHELSQPLGAILRNAESAEIMLKQEDLDTEELRAIVDDILRDDQRAGDVIQKLRSLFGKGELKLQPLDLPGVISDVLALLRTDAAARHVRLESDIASGIPEILGDRIHLQQVLLNLVVNAMDALNLQPDCAVRVLARALNPTTVEVRVCDNGPGIPEDRFSRLFEPFFTTKATGMGMGLPVSQTIIEAHKGKLTAENQPDGGACFCFTLQTTSNPYAIRS